MRGPTERFARATGALVLVLVLVGCSVLTGCSAEADDQGPLRFPDTGAHVCSASPDGAGIGVGFPLDHDQRVSVTVLGVEAVDQDGLDVGPGVVVDVDRRTRIGVSEWPVPGGTGRGAPRDAVGADVPPDVTTDLVVHVQPHRAGAGGSVGGLVLEYEAAGHRHETDLHTSVILAERCPG